MPIQFISFVIVFTIVLMSSLTVHASTEGERVTILVQLQPVRETGKKWDIGRGADPIFCLERGCYVGRGFIAPAKFFEKQRAYLPAVRTRACRNKLTCIYREVLFPDKKAKVWVIDHDGFRRDYLATRMAEVDQSCVLQNSRLQCFKGIHTSEYSMWIVPEHLADKAGKKTLDYALFKGLSDARERYMAAFLKQQKEKLPEIVSRFYTMILERPFPETCVYEPEVIVEAMYISGILDSNKRQSNRDVGYLIYNKNHKNLNVDLNVRSRNFWNFQRAVARLEKYSLADTRRDRVNLKGLKYYKIGNNAYLDVGWSVKSRADRVMKKCASSMLKSKTF